MRSMEEAKSPTGFQNPLLALNSKYNHKNQHTPFQKSIPVLSEEDTLNQINETSNLVSQKNMSHESQRIEFNVQNLESDKLKNNNSNFDGDNTENIQRIYKDT